MKLILVEIILMDSKINGKNKKSILFLKKALFKIIQKLFKFQQLEIIILTSLKLK